MGYKKTLLEMVQEIMSSTGSGEVNSYADTTESLQVAGILENTYWDIVSNSSFGSAFNYYQLTASSDGAKPTVMYLPDTVVTLKDLSYDWHTATDPSPKFSPILFQLPATFIANMYSLDATDTNVIQYQLSTLGTGTLSVISRNDTHPQYYTTFDDNTILFDSYDASVDSILQSSKTLCYGEVNPTWITSDSFIPALSEKQFTILRNEAKTTAFIELLQLPNTDSAKKARRGWISSQKTGNKINSPRNNLDYVPNYGKRTT